MPKVRNKIQRRASPIGARQANSPAIPNICFSSFCGPAKSSLSRSLNPVHKQVREVVIFSSLFARDNGPDVLCNPFNYPFYYVDVHRLAPQARL